VLAVLFAEHHAGAGGGRVGERSPRDARTLVALGDDGGIVLVGMGGEDVEDARRLAAAAATSVGTGREYVAVSDAATLDRVPLAAGEASDLAVTAAALDRPPGLYTTEDLLLPWALQGAPARRGRLAALVAPLAEHADLILTLQTYLAVDGDGGAAAARLHVHRNTLAYRLRRIRALTGLAPTSLTDAQVLAAALTSRRLEEYDASVPLSVALDLTS
jgi:sugar diacid utilization regulator